MSKAEFVKKWAQLYFVDGLRKLFGTDDVGILPSDSEIFRQEYERAVVFPLCSLSNLDTVNTVVIYKALTISWEFVYLFPYFCSTYVGPRVATLADKAIKGLPFFPETFEESFAVLPGGTGRGVIQCVNSKPVMTLPSTVTHSLEEDPDAKFKQAWAKMYYLIGVREVFHNSKLGRVPSNVSKDYQRTVVEPLRHIPTTEQDNVKRLLLRNPYFLYTFPHFAQQYGSVVWQQCMNSVNSGTLLLYLCNYCKCLVSVLKDDKGVGLLFYSNGKSLLDLPNEYPMLEQESIPSDTLRGILSVEHPTVLEPTACRIKYAAAVAPEALVTLEHYNPNTHEFEISPIQVNSLWIPPHRILNVITVALPSSITEGRTRRAVEYLRSINGLTEEEQDFVNRVGL